MDALDYSNIAIGMRNAIMDCKLTREQIEQRWRDKAMRTCRHCGFVAHCPNCLRDHIHKEHKSAN